MTEMNRPEGNAKCPRCGSEKWRAGGWRYTALGRRQARICRDCRRKYIPNNSIRGLRTPPWAIAHALKKSNEGESDSAIRRQLNGKGIRVSCPTIAKWKAKFEVSPGGELHYKTSQRTPIDGPNQKSIYHPSRKDIREGSRTISEKDIGTKVQIPQQDSRKTFDAVRPNTSLESQTRSRAEEPSQLGFHTQPELSITPNAFKQSEDRVKNTPQPSPIDGEKHEPIPSMSPMPIHGISRDESSIEAYDHDVNKDSNAPPKHATGNMTCSDVRPYDVHFPPPIAQRDVDKLEESAFYRHNPPYDIQNQIGIVPTTEDIPSYNSQTTQLEGADERVITTGVDNSQGRKTQDVDVVTIPSGPDEFMISDNLQDSRSNPPILYKAPNEPSGLSHSLNIGLPENVGPLEVVGGFTGWIISAYIGRQVRNYILNRPFFFGQRFLGISAGIGSELLVGIACSSSVYIIGEKIKGLESQDIGRAILLGSASRAAVDIFDNSIGYIAGVSPHTSSTELDYLLGFENIRDLFFSDSKDLFQDNPLTDPMDNFPDSSTMIIGPDGVVMWDEPQESTWVV